MTPQIQFTLITSKDPANKLFKSDGTKISRGQVFDATYNKISVSSIEELIAGFKKFSNTQAITLGITDKETGKLTTTKKVKDDLIARTKKYFTFPEVGFLLLDYDPSENGYTVESPEHFAKVLRDIDTDLESCDIGVRYGSSYGIMKDGKLISDKKSMHAYIIVKNATNEKITQYKKYLVESAWAKGYGHIELSSIGSVSRRQVFDSTVFSPERLIFEATPTLEAGITKLETQYYIFKGIK